MPTQSEKAQPAFAAPVLPQDGRASEAIRQYAAYFAQAPKAAKAGPELSPIDLMYAYYEAA